MHGSNPDSTTNGIASLRQGTKQTEFPNTAREEKLMSGFRNFKFTFLKFDRFVHLMKSAEGRKALRKIQEYIQPAAQTSGAVSGET